MQRVRILSPVAPPPPPGGRLARPLSTLAGSVLGFRVEWANFERFSDRVERSLLERGVVARTKRWNVMMENRVLSRASEEDQRLRASERNEFAEGLHAAVVGLGA